MTHADARELLIDLARVVAVHRIREIKREAVEILVARRDFPVGEPAQPPRLALAVARLAGDGHRSFHAALEPAVVVEGILPRHRRTAVAQADACLLPLTDMLIGYILCKLRAGMHGGGRRLPRVIVGSAPRAGEHHIEAVALREMMQPLDGRNILPASAERRHGRNAFGQDCRLIHAALARRHVQREMVAHAVARVVAVQRDAQHRIGKAAHMAACIAGVRRDASRAQ